MMKKSPVLKRLFLLGLVVGLFALYHYFIVSPNLSEKADKDHVYTQAQLLDSLRDGAYDKTYLPWELSGADVDGLSEHSRTLTIQFLDGNGDPLGSQVNGVGILCSSYVVTRLSLFNAGNVIENPGSVESISVLLLPNSSFDDDWKVEELKPDPVYFSSEFDFVVFARPNKMLLPVPEGCGTVGNMSDLSVGDVLMKAGSFPPGADSVDRGNVAWLDRERGILLFQGSTGFTEAGSPIYALRDGKPELVGMTIGSFTQYGIETKGLAVSFEHIFEDIKTNIEIELDISK